MSLSNKTRNLARAEKLRRRNIDAKANPDHHFVFIRNGNNGVCVCGVTIRWHQPKGSKWHGTQIEMMIRHREEERLKE